jgi:TPR repeat protein
LCLARPVLLTLIMPPLSREGISGIELNRPSMRRFSLSPLSLIVLPLFLYVAAPVYADDFSDGVTAYDSGDYETALVAFKKAADKGNADAQYNLGFMYVSEQGVQRDYAEAMSWYKKSAAQGNVRAMVNLGRMYAKAQGVPQDYRKAISLYEEAAAKDYPDAMYSLGVIYQTGIGAKQNFKQALAYFQAAAELGNASSQYYLGLMYFKGQGVSENLVEAMKWFILAGDYNDAVFYRRYAEKRMSKEEIAEAQKLADAWKKEGS